MGIFLAILCAIFSAIGDILIKKAYKSFSPFASFIILSIFSLIIWPLSVLFVKFDPNMLLPGFFYGALSGLLTQGYYLYVLNKGELSITGPLMYTFPVFTIIFSIIFNGESLSGLGLWAVLLIIIGTIVVALPSKKKKENIKPNLIFFPLSAAFVIGFSDSISKGFINEAGAGTFLVSTAIIQVIISFICFGLAKGKISELTEAVKNPKNYKHAWFGSIFMAISIMFIFLAFEFADASIASPIIGTAPVFILIFATLFLKEKLAPKNTIGVIIVILGILAASF